MNQTIKKLIDYLFSYTILKVLFGKLKGYLHLGYKIGWQNAYHDLIAVSRRLWFFFLFQVFGALAFVLLSQGKDVLQCLLEDMYCYKLIPSFLLLAGVWFWSLASEFGARMLLYLTDSSNDGISNERKEFRKRTQRFIPAIMATFPFVLYLYAITSAFIDHHNFDLSIVGIFSAFICFLLINLNWALHFYFGKGRNNNSYFCLKKPYQQFIINRLGNILVQDKSILETFPEMKEGDKELYEEIHNTENNKIKLYFRWGFAPLYKWCILYAGITLGLFFLLGYVAGDTTYYKLGTAGIMAIGFTCWLIMFYLLKVFEITEPFGKKFRFLNLPYTSILLVWLLIVSYMNNDHPINFIQNQKSVTDAHLSPKDYFAKWYKDHSEYLKTDINATYKYCCARKDTVCVNDSVRTEKKKVHIILIGCEGGALRTGGFSSMLLGGIQDANPSFRDHLFAYSTVSGGTFGANLFNATAYETNLKNDSLLPLYKEYYQSVDFLAPVAAKLFFGDFINYFIPCYIEKLDREVALETAWKNSWRDYLSVSDNNLLSGNFYSSVKTDGSRPAVFINSTVVESGQRAIISNVQLDTHYFKNVFDLNEEIKENISYATAIALSARFPIVSPAGKLQLDDNYKVHLADGGYYDNMGGTTMLELLNSLTFEDTAHIQIIPHVLQTVFDSHKQEDTKGVSMLNELTEIVTGIYSVRNGHTSYANMLLRRKISEMGGDYLELPVASTPEDVPNNWILSSYAVEHAHKRVQNLLRGKDEIEGDTLLKFLKKAMCTENKNNCNYTGACRKSDKE